MAMTNAEKQKAYRKRQKEKGEKDERTRVYASVLYPESAQPNWRDILTEWHVSALISPLHDKDLNPSGEIKKAHHHIMLMFEGPKTPEQAEEIFKSIGAVGREKIMSTRGYARYLCHLDNPEKTQYNTSDVLCLGGADYYAVINTPSDDSKTLIDVLSFIRKNQIRSLAHLIDYCMHYNSEWFMLITRDKAYIIDKYIKSLAWEIDSGQARNEIISADGEIIEV